MSGLAVLALAIGVSRHRPPARSGWWLLVAGLAAVFINAVWLTAVYLVNGAVMVGGTVHAGLTALTYGLVIAALARLQGINGQRGWSSGVDAAIVGLVAFLVLWLVVFQPITERGSTRILGTVLMPIGVLVAFALLTRLLLLVGLRSRAVGLVVAALALLCGGGLILAVPALRGQSLDERPVAAGLAWIGYCVLIGAAGLDPSLGRLRPQPRPPEARPSRTRVLLLVSVILLGPVVAILEMVANAGATDRPIGAVVALAVSVLLALLLVIRVTQMGLEANRRADEAAAQAHALARSIDAERRLRDQLTYQTLHDPLTGLVNRLVLSERIAHVLSPDSPSQGHGLILLDIDSFETVNDTLGRSVGDDVLVEASRRLLALLPHNATAARIGGDEFAVLLEDHPLDDCLRWTEETRSSLGEPYHRDDSELFLTVSAGVVDLGRAEEQTAPAEAVRDADVALHTAKARGRDQVTVFQPNLRAARRDLARLSAALRRAVRHEALTVLYQPVVDLKTGAIVATEALARWNPDDGPPVPPDVFIPVAEETGLIRPLGRFVLQRACREARSWFVEHDIPVSVNVSGWQLDDPGFVDLVLEMLARTGLPGRALILEVTESTLLAGGATLASEATLRADEPIHDRIGPLRRLRRHGLRVAVDDFGTGYSSLAMVARLPVDILKIDRSFVHGESQTTGDGSTDPFLRTILALATSLDLLTIAEGVETDEQADALRQLRCPMAQGFLFARPAPPSDIDAALRRHRDLGTR